MIDRAYVDRLALKVDELEHELAQPETAGNPRILRQKLA